MFRAGLLAVACLLLQFAIPMVGSMIMMPVFVIRAS